MKRMAMAAGLLLSGCADPYGGIDYGRTALLGAGLGGAAAVAAGALASPYGGHGYGGYGYGPAFGPALAPSPYAPIVPPGFVYGHGGYGGWW